MNIHPTAIISDSAFIGENVKIGPYSVIEDGAHICNGCELLAHVHVCAGVKLGENCRLYMNAVIGADPQDIGFKRELKTSVEVGSGSVIREGVTIHRATKDGTNTTVGSNCFLMANAHIAHDCHVGNSVIMANGSLLGGHVTIGDRVFFSGNAAAHQFVRIGRIAMIGGLSRVGMDVPPFMLLELDNTIRGVNIVGIKRAGFSHEQIEGIKESYRLLYHSDLGFREAYEKIEKEIATPEAIEIVEFCRSTKRGVCRHYSH